MGASLNWVFLLVCALAYVSARQEIQAKDVLENEVVKEAMGELINNLPRDVVDGIVRDPSLLQEILKNMRSQKVQDMDFSERTPVAVALEYLRPNSSLLRRHLIRMVPSDSPTYTNYRTQVNGFLRLVVREDTSQECMACQAGVGLLQTLAGTFPTWSAMRIVILPLCNTLLGAINENLNEMCEGILDTQGLHIYHIMKLSAVNPLNFCESLVACMPETSPRSFGRLGALHAVKAGSPRKADTRITYNNTIRVVHMTDIHINSLYAEGSPSDCGLPVCCKNDNTHLTGSTATAGPHGDYNCKVPLPTFRTLLDKVVEIDPHLVLYTGDSPPHTIWDETLESQLNCTAIVAHEIGNKLPNTYVYAAVGNHDFFPTNLFGKSALTGVGRPDMASISTTMANVTGHLWAPLGDFTQTQLDTMAAGGYYDINTHIPRLRILAFNTDTDMYNMNFYATLNEDHEMNIDMKDHAETTLQAAETNGDKVIVLFHHPVGGSSIPRTSRWWHNLVVRYNTTIVLQLAGHTHNDHFRVFRDPSSEEALGLMLISPSVSPGGQKNPSMRVLHLDPTTLELVDYDQYYFDIMEPNPTVELNYQAKAEYGMDDLSPASWMDLINRFSTTDDAMFQTYHNHRNADSSSPPRTCTGTCKVNELCSLANVNVDDTRACQELHAPTPAPTTVASTSTLGATTSSPTQGATEPPTQGPTASPTSPVIDIGARVEMSICLIFLASFMTLI